MQQLLPRQSVLTPMASGVNQAIENINTFIDNNHSECMSVDISFINILDACHIATMCSTNQYIKNPDVKINWIVSSNEVQEYTKSMSLGNSTFTVV